MKLLYMTLAALVLALTPSLALAHPIQNTGSHMRPNLFHDRSPRMHERNSVAHH